MSKFRRQLMMANLSEPVPPTPPLPYDAEVEWLQSDGNCGISLECEPITKVEVTCQLMQSKNSQRVLAAGVSWTGLCIYENSSKYYATSINSDWKSTSKSYSNKVKIVVDMPNKKTTITPSGSSTSTINHTALPKYENNIALFKNGYSNTENSYMKMWYCKLWRNDNLLYDLIPVRKDGVGYLYDRVGRQLFGNSGTGTFTYGNDVS